MLRVLVGFVLVGLVVAAPVHAVPDVSGVVCDTMRQYSYMGATEVALMLSEDRPVFDGYDAARVAVDAAVVSSCPEFAGRD